ncbi:cysteine desulfurase NifS [Candidatus Bipolaricaulota bacterium]|nr:cysteine desulfurase NifS [Candidatus Bipolaricaulota bacterium]
MEDVIYLDNAATTRVAEEVEKEVSRYFRERYGNPSSLYSLAEETKTEGLDYSRDVIADLLGVDSDEIIFTSGATESDNLAIKGVAFAGEGKSHFITTEIEHHAVLHSFEWLEKNGHEVTYLPVDENGLVNPDDLEDAIRDETKLVSIMYANNEIGTVEPIEELARVAKENGCLFHTDAVQAFGKFPLELEDVDLLSASGHKIYGPKGVGFLYRRKGVRMEPLIHGGGHEGGKRSGTENVPGIVGLAKAAEVNYGEMPDEANRQEELRDRIISRVLEIPETILNGDREDRLPNNANFSFRYVEGESIVMKLNNYGIATSTGSACSSPSLEPSHVLLAIGVPITLAHGSLRVTLGRDTTEEEVDYFLEKIPGVIQELRRASPFSE